MEYKVIYFLNHLTNSAGLVLFLATWLPVLAFAVFLAHLLFRNINFYGKIRFLAAPFLAAVFSRYIITEIIRFFYYRPRPYLTFEDIRSLIDKNSGSFPSGHMAFIFAFAVALYVKDKKWGTILFAAGAVSGVGRIMAGVHFPTDILGGILIGVLTGWTIGAKWLQQKKLNRA